MAARKVEIIQKAHACITIVAIDLCPALSVMVEDGLINHKPRSFNDGDPEGNVLVFIASQDEDLNRRVSSLAQDAVIPVNVIDRLELCTFIMPAIIDRSPIVIGITSGGDAPIIARALKERLETLIPAGLGRLAKFAGSCRDRVKEVIPEGPLRLRFWEGFMDGPIAEYIFAGNEKAAGSLFEENLILAKKGK